MFLLFAFFFRLQLIFSTYILYSILICILFCSCPEVPQPLLVQPPVASATEVQHVRHLQRPGPCYSFVAGQSPKSRCQVEEGQVWVSHLRKFKRPSLLQLPTSKGKRQASEPAAASEPLRFFFEGLLRQRVGQSANRTLHRLFWPRENRTRACFPTVPTELPQFRFFETNNCILKK